MIVLRVFDSVLAHSFHKMIVLLLFWNILIILSLVFYSDLEHYFRKMRVLRLFYHVLEHFGATKCHQGVPIQPLTLAGGARFPGPWV
jgi:hypothetical protein